MGALREAGRKAGIFLLGLLTALLLLEAGLWVLYTLRHARTGRYDPAAARKVLCIGDSFVYGIGASPEMSFPSQLQRLLGPGYTVINAGRGGQNTTDVLKGLEDSIQRISPDTVIILCGGANQWNFRGAGDDPRAKSVLARMVKPLSGTRTARLVKLLSISVKGKAGRAEPERQDRDNERSGHPEKVSWMRYPDFTRLSDDEVAQWVEHFKKGVQDSPADANNHYGLGMIHAARREYAEALACFGKAAGMAPEVADNYLEMGRVYDEMSDFDKAMDCYRKAVGIDAGNSNAYMDIGHTCIHMKRYADALSAFRKVTELAPSESGRLYGVFTIISRDAALEETRREAQRLLRELDPGGKMLPHTLMQSISGENDLPEERLREWIQEDIGEMVRICGERCARVIVLGYPAGFENIDGILREAAERRSVPFVDNAVLFGDLFRRGEGVEKDYFAPDGHCNAKGYGCMAKNIYNVMPRRELQ